MAIVSEINGDLKLALQWAQKSYDKNSNTLAQDYITILQERKKNKPTGPPRQSE